MKNENAIADKTYAFSIRIVKLYQYMISNNKEFVLSKQILKSGTSIGANTEEAIGGISKKDYLAKLFKAYKEARETKYWLRLLKDTGYIKEVLYLSLLSDCEEILKILFSIIKTSKENSK
jgi:four helix bundle protein